jgi:hypothetical protein
MSKGGSTDLEASKVKKILDGCLKQEANRLCAEWSEPTERERGSRMGSEPAGGQ